MEEKILKKYKIKDMIQNIDIALLIISIFLQNFAIIKTKSFGIAASTVILIYIFLKYKLYKQIVNRKNLTIIIGMTIFFIVSQLVNNYLNIMKIFRILMIIFDFLTVYEYISLLNKIEKNVFFVKIFFVMYMVITMYGIYEIIAGIYGLPYILNIFNNNPSYGVKSIYQGYSGWTNTPRIYGTFYEPSAYSIFLILGYTYLIDKEQLKKEEKILITLLAIINLIFTFSRSGWITVVCFIVIYLFFRIIKKEGIVKKIGRIAIILTPFAVLIVMSTLGLSIFKDYSSIDRTNASIYYLEKSGESIESVVLGHGLGGIENTEDVIVNNRIIEKFAHNGYIEILYESGYVFFIVLLYGIVKFINNRNIENNWSVFSVIFTICCFGSMYNVETIIIMVGIVISTEVCKEKNKLQGEENDIDNLSK